LVHWAEPVMFAKVPAAQGWHSLMPCRLWYEPASHGAQEDWPLELA
jgi:hypothetical protein